MTAVEQAKCDAVVADCQVGACVGCLQSRGGCCDFLLGRRSAARPATCGKQRHEHSENSQNDWSHRRHLLLQRTLEIGADEYDYRRLAVSYVTGYNRRLQ